MGVWLTPAAESWHSWSSSPQAPQSQAFFITFPHPHPHPNPPLTLCPAYSRESSTVHGATSSAALVFFSGTYAFAATVWPLTIVLIWVSVASRVGHRTPSGFLTPLSLLGTLSFTALAIAFLTSLSLVFQVRRDRITPFAYS